MTGGYDFSDVNSSCMKVFRTHTFYEGEEGDLSRPPTISETVDSTAFNFDRPLGLAVRRKRLAELMI